MLTGAGISLLLSRLEALAATANAIFKRAVATPAGAARSEVGWQPSLLGGRVFGVSSCTQTMYLSVGRAACLSHSFPCWENVLLQRRRSA